MNLTVAQIQEQIRAITAPYIDYKPVKPLQLPSMDIGLGYRPWLSPKRREEQIRQLRQYYQYWYPQYPFLTEQDVREICIKHNLRVGYLPLFMGKIPTPNRKGIEIFDKKHFRKEDRSGGLYQVVDPYHYKEEAGVLRSKGIMGYIDYQLNNRSFHAMMGIDGGEGSRESRSPIATFRSYADGFRHFIPISEKITLFHDFAEGAQSTSICIGIQIRNGAVIDTQVDTDNERLQAGNAMNPYTPELNKMLSDISPDMQPYTENLYYIEIPICGSNYVEYIQNVIQSFGTVSSDWVDSFSSRKEINNTQTVRIDVAFLERALGMLYNMLDGGHIVTRFGPARKIIAPATDFVQGMEEVKGYRYRFNPNELSFSQPEGEDPIPLQPVPYGYLMVTQWGNDTKGEIQNPFAN